MYSCDTCCNIRKMMEMDSLDCAKCQKSRRMDTLGIYKIVNEEKTKDEQCSSSSKETKKRVGEDCSCSGWIFWFLERKGVSSL